MPNFVFKDVKMAAGHEREDDKTPNSQINFNSNLITNEGSNTLKARLESLICKYKRVDICAISGFFNARAFEWLANFGEKIGDFALILGKNEPSNNANLGIAFYINDPFDFSLRDLNAQLGDIKATRVAANFIKNKAVRIYTLKNPDILVHSKLYYLYECENPLIESNAIVGSSNFTASGLGLYDDFSNKELNLLCDSKNATKECKSYFDALLENCDDATQKVLDALNSYFFYHTPQDIIDKIAPFYKSETEDLNKQEERDLKKGARIFGLFDFQKFAAAELLKRLKTYGVAMLADPVGSGKTLTALGVAFAYNRVVIITPPKLKNQWESYFTDKKMDADIFSYDEAIKAQTLKASKIYNANLLIIDESHHFRNDNATYREFKEKLNKDSDILLLSATPINNGYEDLGRQLSLNKNNIEINGQFYDPLKICIQANINAKKGKAVLNSSYYKLCNLIFSRSSKDIENFLIAKNKALPKQEKSVLKCSSIPENVNFSLDKLLEILGINDSDNAITLCIYDPFDEKFLPAHIIGELKKKNLDNLGEYSTPRGFLCMNLVKALESSLDAFLKTLETIIKYHKDFLKIYESNENFELEILKDSERDDELFSAFPQRLKSVIKNGFLRDLNENFVQNIIKDKEILENLQKDLSVYDSERDFKTSDKFKRLCEMIKKIGTKINEEKLLIFTESITTANAITRTLQAEFANLNISAITGNSSPAHFQKSKNLFSPKSLNYKLEKDEREIDILVATDCLSEGQNLQDCANFLNWDIAFNPVRSIQRIGRIWRIGSEHPINRITHFFPEKLDKYIQLEAKLRYKLEAASSATEVDNPFSQNQISNELHFNERKKQYEAIESDIILSEENSSFANIQAILEINCSKEPKNLNDGIFSIALDENYESNLLFVSLQSNYNKLYNCIFDLTKKELRASAEEKDCIQNFKEILQLNNKNKPYRKEFEKLEILTKDYSDLSVFKSVFKELLEKLNLSIDDYEEKLENSKQSDGGLFFVEPRKFKLIAWLLINPNFEILQKNYAKKDENE